MLIATPSLHTGIRITALTASLLGGFAAVPAHAAVVFSQDFSAGNPVSQYESATPTVNQFTDFFTSTGTTISAASNALVYTRTGGSGTFTRTDNFLGAATLFSMAFDLNVTGTGASTSGAILRVGNAYVDDGSTPSNANTYSRFGFNIPASGNTFQVREVTGGTNSSSFSGTQTVRWYNNNSGSSSSYTDPNGSSSSVANDTFDLWVGTTLVFNDIAVLTPTQSINDIKLNWSGGTGTMTFDNFVIRNDLDLIASGNDSVITVSPSSIADFGRVMVGSSNPTNNATVSKTGTSATTWTATASTDAFVAGASGSFASGAQSDSIDAGINRATAGVKSGTITIDNTAADSAGAGQGSADPNDTITVSGTVVDNRVVTASNVTIGSVIVGTSLSLNSNLTTTGSDDVATRVTVATTAAANGDGITIASGSGTLFDAATDTGTRTLGGSFTTAGAKSSFVTLTTTGEGLTGEVPINVNVNYTATALDPSNASFNGVTNLDTLTLDFGSFVQGSGLQNLTTAIHNLVATLSFTAGLDFDTISGIGDTSVLTTDLNPGEFLDLAAGTSHLVNLVFDTSNAVGAYTATYTLGLSDNSSIFGASAPSSQVITLTLTGTITAIPEPASLLLLTLGSASLLARRRG